MHNLHYIDLASVKILWIYPDNTENYTMFTNKISLWVLTRKACWPKYPPSPIDGFWYERKWAPTVFYESNKHLLRYQNKWLKKLLLQIYLSISTVYNWAEFSTLLLAICMTNYDVEQNFKTSSVKLGLSRSIRFQTSSFDHQRWKVRN